MWLKANHFVYSKRGPIFVCDIQLLDEVYTPMGWQRVDYIDYKRGRHTTRMTRVGDIEFRISSVHVLDNLPPQRGVYACLPSAVTGERIGSEDDWFFLGAAWTCWQPHPAGVLLRNNAIIEILRDHLTNMNSTYEECDEGLLVQSCELLNPHTFTDGLPAYLLQLCYRHTRSFLDGVAYVSSVITTTSKKDLATLRFMAFRLGVLLTYSHNAMGYIVDLSSEPAAWFEIGDCYSVQEEGEWFNLNVIPLDLGIRCY
jgi:hypothetical protein